MMTRIVKFHFCDSAVPHHYKFSNRFDFLTLGCRSLSLKMMNRCDANKAESVNRTRPSYGLANRTFYSGDSLGIRESSGDNISFVEPIFVGSIQIFPACYRLLSTYSYKRHPSANNKNGVSQTENSVSSVESKQSKFKNRHPEKRRTRIDPRQGHEHKELQKNELFDICIPTREISSSMLGDISDVNDSKNQILRPRMVLLKRFLSLSEQIDIVTTCRKLGLDPAGFYQPQYHSGAKLRLQMMCMGLHWNHLTREYKNQRPEGTRPPSIPKQFSLLVEKAVNDACALVKMEVGENSSVENILPGISPDICIANFYETMGRLGLHQDRDESAESLRKGLPVVSFSIGDSAEFMYGDQRDIDKASKIVLESGDVLIFGGESRHIFHGVKSIIQNSAPIALLNETRLRPGRLNLTFRQF